MSIGKVVTTENNEINQDGAFVRQTNRFDTPFGNEPGLLPVESGRQKLREKVGSLSSV